MSHTNNKKTVRMMGVPMHPWTMDETLDEISRRLDEGKFTQHVVINVAKLVKMQTDIHLRNAILACDIINIDGMGVVWGARFLGFEIPERVAGIDLFLNLLKLASEHDEPVYFLGAKPEVVEQTVVNMKDRFPLLKISGWHHGYFWDNENDVVSDIHSSEASMLFVGISSPKKEQFINRWRNQLGVKFVMGVGGTFDVIAGITRRAPIWMQNAGLEWLYRVIQEPRRMWKRYLVTNSKFIWMLAKEKMVVLKENGS
jgi:N-acetylglucosaminyldiphosphoundecaprenol N-acetyl-beta-D-mannosaminyltransferase